MEHTLSNSMAAIYVQGSSSQTNIKQGSSSNSHSTDSLLSATVGTIRPRSFYPAPLVQHPLSLQVPPVQQHSLPMPPSVQFSPYGYGYGFAGSSKSGFSASNSSQGFMFIAPPSNYRSYNGHQQRGNGNFKSNFHKGRDSNSGYRQGQWNGNTDSWFNMQPECQICQRRGHTAPNCYYRSSSSSSTVTACQIWGKWGYIALECYHRGNYAFQGHAPPSAFNNMPKYFYSSSSTQFPGSTSHLPGPIPSFSNMTAMNAHVVAPYPTGDAWIVDTGASHYMTSDVSNFSQPIPFDGLDRIKIGNGQGQGNKGDTIQRQE